MVNPVIITPEDGVTAASNGCPVLTKTRAFNVDRGLCATLDWQMRDGSGNPIDLTSLLGNDDPTLNGTVMFRFTDAITPDCKLPLQLSGYLSDPTSGQVRVDLTSKLVAVAGLLEIGIGITNADNQLVLVNNALMSVERGLFGDLNRQIQGPPTLNDIRLQLRDTMTENSLQELPEFSDQEIIYCMAKPLRNWNETPPPVFRVFSYNFPYRDNWLKATCGELFALAATWYTRNRFNASGGGIQDDALAKAQDYQQAAMMLQQGWTTWMASEKNRISSLQFMGTFGSGYPSRGWAW